MTSGWEGRFIILNFGKEEFAFQAVDTTTFEDLLNQSENILSVVNAVIASVEELEEGEKISSIDFMDCVVQTIAENLTNAAGDPMKIEPCGIGVTLVKIAMD